MNEKAVDRNQIREDRISPEFVLSQYSAVLKTLKDEEMPEARTSLAGLIRQLIYVTPPEKRFFSNYVARCLSQCSQDEQDLERIKESFHHLQTYCENLVKMFWKKEVKIIKRHTGLYKNLLDVLSDVDRCMEDIGYYHDHQTDTLVLKSHDILDMEKVMKLGFDWFMTQVILQFLEDVYCDLKHDGYSWKQVTKDGIRFVGTEQECLKWFRDNVPSETDPLRTGSEKRLKRVNHSETNGRGATGDLYVNMKGATGVRLPHEGLDPSYNNVEKWLKDSLSNGQDYHRRRIEQHKEAAKMAQREEEQRRKYSDMKKYHQPSAVTGPYGEKLKFDPIDDDVEKTRVVKTSPNMRKKVAEKREELPVAVPKSYTRDRRCVNNAGASSSAVSNGRTSSRGTSSQESKKSAMDVPSDRADYNKFLEEGTFTLDDENEDLYSDMRPTSNKLPLKTESFVMVDRKGVKLESHRQAARPLSAVHTHLFARETGLRDGLDTSKGNHNSGTFGRKANVPDVYSMHGTQEDHMKNSLNALGLESGASSMDCGFDEWVKDYRERDEAAEENKHLDLDWGRYKNLESAAQDYLGNKIETSAPEGKSLFDFDIPSMDIRRPPGASDLGIDETPLTGKFSKFDINVQSDGNCRHAKPVDPSIGLMARSVSLSERPSDTKRPASSRNSVHLSMSDAPVSRAGQFPSYRNDSNRRATLASQAVGADFTRPEYAQILKDSISMRGAKRNSIPNRNMVTTSLTNDLKQDRELSQKYNTLPSSSSVWKCNNCDKINVGSRSDICEHCMRGREYIPKWQCQDCTFLNPANSNVCHVCGKSRTKGSEKTSLQLLGRECSKCTYINSTDAKKCEICQEPLIVYAVHI
ncbi:uncharacterized protein LOC135495421 [Lineus longissimus]|uniref:uncharacterized protein LOC135495421 n=1 Tax=Lineus longissimus TaxID=88925 RepID=UPI002B4E82F2